MFVTLLLATAAALPAPSVPLTLRLDFFHTGSVNEEWLSLDGLAVEGTWPGPLAQTIDETNLGRYLFEVRDLPSNALLYSRGFASIYGEWETTDEARTVRRTFHESLRFPLPLRKAQVIVKKRDVERGGFRELWSHSFDPADALIDRGGPPADVVVWAVHESGPPAQKVDLLLIGDGYTAAERDKWHNDARRLTAELFKVSPLQREPTEVQRLGDRCTCRTERRFAAVQRNVSLITGACDLRCLRIRALRAELRQQTLA